jgi:hypothetical protein
MNFTKENENKSKAHLMLNSHLTNQRSLCFAAVESSVLQNDELTTSDK